jgi:hypothetical protein
MRLHPRQFMHAKNSAESPDAVARWQAAVERC